jgi:transposase
MARPTKLTEATIERLCETIRVGATWELACKYAGINSSTLRHWRIAAGKGKKNQTALALLARLDAAEGQAAIRWLAHIELAAQQGQWQAAAWKLERRYPEQYGRQILHHEHEVGEGLSGLLQAFGEAEHDANTD